MKKTALFLLVLLVSCSSQRSLRVFSERDPILVDEGDFRLLAEKPKEYKPSTIWDGADELILRPIPNFFSFRGKKRALNVNALDEVPESSWWSQKEKNLKFTKEMAAAGACKKTIDPRGPFEVLSSKPDGFNPGFLVKAPDGRKYFFKFDQHELQLERMSSAEVIGSLIYHSVGFTVPCYEILYFDRSALFISKTATMKNKKGEKVPLTEEVITEAFRLAKKTEDGKVRSVSSLLLEGTPLGPWTYSGTTADDPNDVIDHEHRREVRSGYVLASWISHFDTRDQNTLSTWIEDKEKKQGYVRHNILDFGDSIGNLSDDDAISRRLGYAYYLDFPYFIGDFFTLGVVERPWDKVKYGPAGSPLGYFDVENFDPETWHPGYPNPAFQEMQEADGAWMARQISKFRNEHLKSIVDLTRIQNTIFKEEILKNLIGRRDKLLRRWLTKLSSLSDPQISESGDLCLFDYGLFAHLFTSQERTYQAYRVDVDTATKIKESNLKTYSKDYQVCVNLGALNSNAKSYSVVEILGISQAYSKELPVRVHLRSGSTKWKIAGLERE